MLAHQRQFLDDLFASRSAFTLTRPGRGKFHVALIDDPQHAWCGQQLHREKRIRATWSELLPDTLCPACLQQLAAARGVAVGAL